MARKTVKKTAVRRKGKVAERVVYPDRIDEPEGGVPDYEVHVTPMGDILTRIEVTNVDTGQKAMSSCGPKDDIDGIVDGLKKRLYHR